MNSKTQEPLRNDAQNEDLVVLGVASIDTQGGPLSGEDVGGLTFSGIAQD
jgi:hypothetical protein